MSRHLLVPAVVLFLLCPAFAQTQAVLRPNGPVKINGSVARLRGFPIPTKLAG
jgi:hypothetical protein